MNLEHAQTAMKIILHAGDAREKTTDALQAESRGEELEYSILFSHAQDTCMCASSELNVAMHLVDLFEVIDKRFKKLENK